MEASAGRSWRSERRWGLIGGLVGSAAGVGSFLIASLIQGEALRDLAGSPYPPFFTRRTMMPLDYYFVVVLLVGVGFLAAALVITRRGRYPRSDGYGAVLTGAVLCAVAGVALFLRLWAVVHG